MKSIHTDTNRSFLITGGTVITPEEILKDASILIQAGRIASVHKTTAPSNAIRIRANGKLVMPGIVDLHSDALEKFIEPRTSARFPLDIAISEFDKFLAACGITTMFHCICYVSSEAGRTLRSIEMADKTVRLM